MLGRSGVALALGATLGAGTGRKEVRWGPGASVLRSVLGAMLTKVALRSPTRRPRGTRVHGRSRLAPTAQCLASAALAECSAAVGAAPLRQHAGPSGPPRAPCGPQGAQPLRRSVRGLGGVGGVLRRHKDIALRHSCSGPSGRARAPWRPCPCF